MTSSGTPQPRELDPIVRDAAVLDAPMPASEEVEPIRARVPARRADELVDSHYESVYRYAYRLCGCVASAEDITQETFVQAIRHLDQLRAGEAERSWLLTIARRQFMRLLRKVVHTKHGRMLSIDSPNVNADAVLCESVEVQSPQKDLENQDCVERALSELGHDARVIIVMHYFEELSYAEIASQLEIPIGTVMSRLSRSREQLRKLLDDDVRPAAQPSTAASSLSQSQLAQPHLAGPNLSQEARHG